jgi:hypothetical protein
VDASTAGWYFRLTAAAACPAAAATAAAEGDWDWHADHEQHQRQRQPRSEQLLSLRGTRGLEGGVCCTWELCVTLGGEGVRNRYFQRRAVLERQQARQQQGMACPCMWLMSSASCSISGRAASCHEVFGAHGTVRGAGSSTPAVELLAAAARNAYLGPSDGEACTGVCAVCCFPCSIVLRCTCGGAGRFGQHWASRKCRMQFWFVLTHSIGLRLVLYC